MTTIRTINNNLMDYDAVVSCMDDELREELHSAYCGEVTEQEFYNIYCDKHLERFGEDFIVN